MDMFVSPCTMPVYEYALLPGFECIRTVDETMNKWINHLYFTHVGMIASALMGFLDIFSRWRESTTGLINLY